MNLEKIINVKNRLFNKDKSLATLVGIISFFSSYSINKAQPIQIDPNNPEAINIINNYASQNSSEIYLTDGDLGTVDTLELHCGEEINITGNNVELYGENQWNNTIIKRDNQTINDLIIRVTGNGSYIHDFLLRDGSTGILYEGTNYGEVSNFVKRVKITDMGVNGIQWNNYQRQNINNPSLVIEDTLIDNIVRVGAEYKEGVTFSTTPNSPYGFFGNDTFNGLAEYESVAIIAPYLWNEQSFLNEGSIIESSVISGGVVQFLSPPSIPEPFTYELLNACIKGPIVQYPAPECNTVDKDNDTDVDLKDFAKFVEDFTP